MDNSEPGVPVRPAPAADRTGGSLAEEVRASALLLGLVVLATVCVGLLMYLLLPTGP